MFKPIDTAAAIAPFRKVVQNLKGVVAVQNERKRNADNELTSARNHFDRVVETKSRQIAAADAEKAKAEKLLAKLEALLADD